jgi:hypothetical protein
MAGKTFVYRGDLAVTPLAEILATIYRYRVPGTVSVSQEKRARRIYLEDGLVLFAASNEPDLDLASHLLRQGTLDAETARLARERQARDGLRMGQVLLQMGVVTPERLNAAVSSQVREIVVGALEWEEGEVVFEVGARRTTDFVRVDLAIPEVILGGVRRAQDVKRFARRLGSAATQLEKAFVPPPSLFSASELEFYESVDGKTALRDLCARGPGGMGESARLLYAFYCLGFLRKARGAAAPGAKKILYRTEGGSLGT